MIPQIDSKIGISVYTTKFAGTGGSIRDSPEDFQVSEVISESALRSIKEESGYAVYLLKKKNIDTAHALSTILKKTGIRLKALGLKDALAVTQQFVCASGKGKSLEAISAGRLSLERLGFVKKPLSKKNMIGNSFKIKISNLKQALNGFSEQERILNFYGYQRFGSKRPVTHLVGKAILQRDFGKAVELILSYTSEYDSRENSEIRQKLSDKTNYKKYLNVIPPQMDIERTVLEQMVSHDDPLRALRAIPITLRRFYVQAYQSFLFNHTLSEAFSKGEDLFKSQEGDVCFDSNGVIGKHTSGLSLHLAVPCVGYSYYKKTRFHYYISKIAESEEISPKDFFIREMQEASSEGGFRQSAIHCTKFRESDGWLEFTLSRGSFATIVLREIMKPDDPILAGF